MSATIGREVSLARAEAGLSLAEVAERTRIRATVIGEIEADNFAHCGGDVYAKGHLRAIGSALGVDATEWVAAYDAEYGSTAPSVSEVFESETAAPRRRRGANWSGIMSAALVVAVGLVVAQVVTTSDDGRQSTTVAEPAPTPTDADATDDPTDDPTQVAQAPKEVVVRITALPTARSWVRVTRPDGSAVFEGNIRDGSSKTFRDRDKLKLLLGCASAVELTVNGQDIGTPSDVCGLVDLTFTPKDPAGSAG